MVFDEQTLAVCHRAAGADGETSSGGSSHWDSDHLLTKHCTVHKHTCVIYKKKRRWMLLYSQNLLFDLRDVLWPQQTSDWPPPSKKNPQILFASTSSFQPSEPPGATKNSLRLEALKTDRSRHELGSISRIVRFLGVFGVFFSPRQLNFVFWRRKVHMV